MSIIEIYFNWNYPLTNQETTLYIPQKEIGRASCRERV